LTLPELVLIIVLTTASGALAPGPMFAANIIYGSRHGARSGLLFSIGHTMIELPLVLLLGLGLVELVAQPQFVSLVGMIGGVALIAFGIYQIKGAVLADSRSSDGGRSKLGWSSITAGVIFTALNPFFLLWWLSIGSRLIIEALIFASLAGILVLFAAHIWMDYVWLIFVAYLAKRGMSIVGTRGYRGLLAVSGFLIIYFGYIFLASSNQSCIYSPII
jgi:threonine/homoserine/homoserine lactone efflux protein